MKQKKLLRFGASARLPDGTTIMTARGRVVLAADAPDGSRLSVLAWHADGHAIRARFHRVSDGQWLCRAGDPDRCDRPLWLVVCLDGRQQVVEVLSEELSDVLEYPLDIFRGVPREGPYGTGGITTRMVMGVLCFEVRRPDTGPAAQEEPTEGSPFVARPVPAKLDLTGLLVLDEEHMEEVMTRSLAMTITRHKDRMGIMVAPTDTGSLLAYTFAESADVADAEEMTVSVHCLGTRQALQELAEVARNCLRVVRFGEEAMGRGCDQDFEELIVERARQVASEGIKVIRARNRNRF